MELKEKQTDIIVMKIEMYYYVSLKMFILKLSNKLIYQQQQSNDVF